MRKLIKKIQDHIIWKKRMLHMNRAINELKRKTKGKSKEVAWLCLWIDRCLGNKKSFEDYIEQAKAKGYKCVRVNVTEVSE